MCHIQGQGAHYRAEEATCLDSKAVRPCQWHITRGGPTIEKNFWRGG